MPRLLVTDVRARCLYSRLSLPPTTLAALWPPRCWLPSAPCRSTGSCSTEVLTVHSSMCLEPFPLPNLRTQAALRCTPLFHAGVFPQDPAHVLACFSWRSDTSVSFSRDHLLEGPPSVLLAANLFEFWTNRHFGARFYYKITTHLPSSVCFATGGGGIRFSVCGPGASSFRMSWEHVRNTDSLLRPTPSS